MTLQGVTVRKNGVDALMSKKKEFCPWAFLDAYRNDKWFEGKWPTLPQMFDISVDRYGERPCLREFVPEDWRLTYDQARQKIVGLANHFVSRGYKKGDKIAVCGRNSITWVITYYATVYAGCVIVPLDAKALDKDLEKFMEFAEVKCLVADLDKLKHLEKDGQLELDEKLCLEKESASYTYVLDVLEGTELSENVPKVVSDDMAAILFTSGTTGTPRGVMLTNENLVSDCYQAQSNMELFPTDVFYAILPIHHAYTMQSVMIEALSVGAEAVMGKRLVISQVLKELKQGKVTMFLGVPMLFNKMLSGLLEGVKKESKIGYVFIRMGMGLSGFVKKLTGKNIGHPMFNGLLAHLSLDTNRICICGGGPLPSSTFKMFNELGIDFVQGYGLTETSPITHLNPIYAYVETSVGKVCAGIEQKIVDPDENGNGLIYLKGSCVMKGYYKNEEATREILTEDGWLNTGDVGHIDKKGYLYLTGRAKNIIVTEGGKNVFPEEIEDKFQLFDDIEQICIIPYVKNEKTKAEGIKAIVYPSEVLRKGDPEECESKIKRYVATVNKDLPSFKKIEKIVIAKEELAMTSTRKIQRFTVRKQYSN